MQTNNPFELILSKLEQIQATVDALAVKASAQNLQEQPDPDRIIDLPEAARILCKPIGTVRAYIHSRNLPGKLVGTSYLIKYQELIKWFENFQTGYELKTPNIATDKMIENRNRYRKY